MKAVLQRVKNANVIVNEKVVGEISKGFLVLLGICEDDDIDKANILSKKIANLRVFEDDNGKMNLSLLDINAQVLLVPNFTLCADVRKGNRPSFTKAAKPDISKNIYEYFIQRLNEDGIKKVEHGIFGADMQVSLVNDGPVTIILDTNTL